MSERERESGRGRLKEGEKKRVVGDEEAREWEMRVGAIVRRAGRKRMQRLGDLQTAVRKGVGGLESMVERKTAKVGGRGEEATQLKLEATQLQNGSHASHTSCKTACKRFGH
eukprot:3400557-Pleurochrysis_carterae.AAC.1